MALPGHSIAQGFVKSDPLDDDFGAGVESMGFNPVAEDATDSQDPFASREDLIFDQLVELLLIKKRNSEMFQAGNYQKNTVGLQEADRLRRKLGG